MFRTRALDTVRVPPRVAISTRSLELRLDRRCVSALRHSTAPLKCMRSLSRSFLRPSQISSVSRLLSAPRNRRMHAAAQDWATVNDASGRKAYDVYTKPLEKGRLDDREYRYIRLPNALEALLISDPKADKAAAALDVEVGHLSDPVSPTFWLLMTC